jgi:hypothetical protein
MSFIVYCPHASCRKQRLAEGAQGGSEAECLLCMKEAAADPSSWGDLFKLPVLPTTAPGAPPAAARPRIVNCPQCNTFQRTRPTGEDREITCPQCRNVFTP